MNSRNRQIERPFEQFAEAIKAGDCARIRQWVNTGCDVNAKDADEFPIMRYAANEHVIHLLVELGCDLNLADRRGATWLHYANSWELEVLLRCGADPNIRDRFGETPLFVAQQSGQADNAALLIAHGADPNVQASDNGWTVLHGAIVNGQYEMARLLGSV